MTEDKIAPLLTQTAVPSQNGSLAPSESPVKDDLVLKGPIVEEEPYTIKCICNFSDDDGNTIYCETCDTWQHIECFYPDNRDEAIREDFAHSCAECKPRPLNRQKAIERTLGLKNSALPEGPTDKKTKRPLSKSQKKKSRPTDLAVNGTNGSVDGRHGSATDQGPPPKRVKSSHRPSQSISSQHSKRSPSYNNPRSTPAHPLSPATTPPDLPDDFHIHDYSASFFSLYNEHKVTETHNNAFVSIAIPTALSCWLREPNAMQQEVGRIHSDVFQDAPSPKREAAPKLDVSDATRPLKSGTTLRWRSLKATSPVEKDVPLIELHGEIGFQKDYCANPDNLWTDLSSPLPFVFFHPTLPLYIDTRKEGSLARYVRRSCKPNAQLDTYLSDGSEYHFWLVSDRYISSNEQITLPWDFRLERSVHSRWLHLLGLSDDDTTTDDDTEMDESEYIAISNWIDRILSEHGGCACELENNCAFARFHRHYHYLFGKSQGRANHPKRKHRKQKTQTISPSSTGHATNSRAASEGHGEDDINTDGRSGSASSRSKPPSRERSPVRQGSFDQLGILTEPTDRDKRKVAMVEDSFRRMEQQQPIKKKKRVSDGATTTTSKTKPRTGSTQSHSQYVDASTPRSKSGSPASIQSPQFGDIFNGTALGRDQSRQSRQSSASPHPDYCNASVQTDPVEGEWFSGVKQSPRPKRKIVPLSKRLLSSRLRVKTQDELNMQTTPSQSVGAEAMEEDPPKEQKPSVAALDTMLDTSASDIKDVVMNDAPSAPSTNQPPPVSQNDGKPKTPDLRVQLPPVPTFDNSSVTTSTNATTPLSATSSIAQSPLSMNSLPSPFVASAVNGIAVQPSPVKKKLSLSDYTKSRMNKSGSKAPNGSAILKQRLSSPEEMKLDLSGGPQNSARQDERQSNSVHGMNGSA